MTVRQAAREAGKTIREKKGEVFDFMLLEIMVRLIVMTPLLFLLTPDRKWFALLCVPLFLLLVPFARARAARQMLSALRGGPFFSRSLLDLEGYGSALLRGLGQAGLLILWALPFLGVTVYLWRVIFGSTVVGQTDVFSVMMAVSRLGGGDLVRGAAFAVLIYLATLLPFCFGLAFHSGARFAREEGNPGLVRSHRKGIILAWFFSLLALIPFAAVSGFAVAGYLGRLLEAVNRMSGSGLSLPSPGSGIYVIAGAFVVLALPVVPFRSLVTAAYVKGLAEDAGDQA